jgi:hypothetical protein
VVFDAKTNFYGLGYDPYRSAPELRGNPLQPHVVVVVVAAVGLSSSPRSQLTSSLFSQ